MFRKGKKYGECSYLAKYALADAAGVLIYVLGVSWIMTDGDRIFGPVDTGRNIFGPTIVLMLLVLSVAVVGTLIFGRPILLYLDGKKKEGVKILIMTLFAMFLLTAVLLTIGLVA